MPTPSWRVLKYNGLNSSLKVLCGWPRQCGRKPMTTALALADRHARAGDAAGDVARAAELPAAHQQVLARGYSHEHIDVPRRALLAFRGRRHDL